MAEVFEETLTTKEETKNHGKRQTERSTSGRVPKKRRSTRRTASQAQEETAQANGASKHHSVADQHPGNDGVAQTGDSGAGESGIERLIDAANKTLAERCQALPTKLADRALEGHESAARLLIMLAERKKPRKVPLKKPQVLTLAQTLAAEPQWKVEEEEQPQQAAESSGAGELVNNGG